MTKTSWNRSAHKCMQNIKQFTDYCPYWMYIISKLITSEAVFVYNNEDNLTVHVSQQ
jgi:hypothetical protein